VLAGTKRLRTVGDWLRFAVTVFTRAPLTFAQGLHGPQEEAMFLVGRFLGLEQADLPTFLGARLTRDEVDELGAMIVARVERHEPIPYLVHEAWLGGLRFYVDRRVLIPRSYIAALLPDAVQEFAGAGWKPRRILDVGTGCGCLAILAARAFPEAIVDAVDVSADALEVAERNVGDHGLGERVHVLQSDLFATVPALPYDLILANPPYEPTAVVTARPPELQHEPVLALDGGANGLDCVRRILAEARVHLTPRGVLILEHGDLRRAIGTEFPKLTHDVFPLPDETDAVIGVRAADLPAASGKSKQPRRR
jgi:ribosomal protein L3 glutamine methyltransferase